VSFRRFEKSGQLKVLKRTRATRLLTEGDGGGAVTGLQWASVTDPASTGTVRAGAVVLATGGYANDHTHDSLLAQYVLPCLTHPRHMLMRDGDTEYSGRTRLYALPRARGRCACPHARPDVPSLVGYLRTKP
jgi:glycine/D-amino acid oxidase-like deaminating enzyme